MKLSLSLVCDENFGSGIFADKTQVRPSLISSPEIANLFFLRRLCSFAYLFITLVNALLKPNKWFHHLFDKYYLYKGKYLLHNLHSILKNIQFLYYLFFLQYKLVFK